jgi:ABC-type multidrug transport system fused ATPase/permease subunit
MKAHFLKHVILGLIIVAGFSAVVMLLWNFAVPSIFGLTVINFWQALVLLVLARILFGNLCGRFKGGSENFHQKNAIREKWMKMTPEERKEFLKKRHFGHGHAWAQNFGDEFFNDESKKEEKRD